MRKTFKQSMLLISGCVLCLVAPVLTAQEGHPLRGSWLGLLHSAGHADKGLLLVMDWNGTAITGTINPGTENVAIVQAEMDVENWTVSIAARTAAKGNSADEIRYALDGQLKDIELPGRSITGTWQKAGESGSFELIRQ